MPILKLKDGLEFYYKDWNPTGSPTVVFSHGWPLNSDNFENQMYFLASKGCRVVAHDRRGHGRTSQPWEGNDMDTYSDDLLQLFEHLDLKDVMMVGHSTGGGEVARFCGRHGTKRVKKAVMISAIPPLMLKTEKNPGGLPIEFFNEFRANFAKDRAQFFIDVPSGPFFGFNRPGANVSQGLIWSWWQQGMMCGYVGAYECTRVFSETDCTEDLKSMKIPVLLLHGDDDQIVPIDAAARAGIKLLPNGRLKEYPGGPHALPNIHAEEINKDLWDFLNE